MLVTYSKFNFHFDHFQIYLLSSSILFKDHLSMSFDFISSQDFSIIFLFFCVDLQYLLLRWLLFLSLNMSSLSDLLKSNQKKKKRLSILSPI